MSNYLQIPISRRGRGYLPVLRSFRTEIPLATGKHYRNIEYTVEGDLPGEVVQHLPLFGHPLVSDHWALNSGGRGILLSDGKTRLRFKGNDINGSITSRAGFARNNHISDIRFSAESQVAQFISQFHEALWSDQGIYQVPEYGDGRPFSFFTRDSVEKERHACTVIGDAFEKKGFARPYTYKACITYPNVQYRGELCSTIVFSLPSIESDLRFEELHRLGFLHLKFASPDELQELKDDLEGFLVKLTSWHGFVTRIFSERHLTPHPASHQHQNYVLCHVSDEEVGASRVDHTSTIVDYKGSRKYVSEMKEEAPFFANLSITLIHALELARQNHKLDRDRYTGYFDRAYKWYEPIDYREIPGMMEHFDEIKEAFKQGFQKRNPIPIPEKDLANIVWRIAAVRMDMEWQNRIEMMRNEILGKLFLKG